MTSASPVSDLPRPEAAVKTKDIPVKLFVETTVGPLPFPDNLHETVRESPNPLIELASVSNLHPVSDAQRSSVELREEWEGDLGERDRFRGGIWVWRDESVEKFGAGQCARGTSSSASFHCLAAMEQLGHVRQIPRVRYRHADPIIDILWVSTHRDRPSRHVFGVEWIYLPGCLRESVQRPLC